MVHRNEMREKSHNTSASTFDQFMFVGCIGVGELLGLAWGESHELLMSDELIGKDER